MKNQRPMTCATKFLNLQCSRSTLKVLPFLCRNYQSVHKVIIMFLLLWTINPAFINAQDSDDEMEDEEVSNENNDNYVEDLYISEDELKTNPLIRSISTNQIMAKVIQNDGPVQLNLSSRLDESSFTEGQFEYDIIKDYVEMLQSYLDAYEVKSLEIYSSEVPWKQRTFWEQYKHKAYMNIQNESYYEFLIDSAPDDALFTENLILYNEEMNAYRAALLYFQQKMTDYRNQYKLIIHDNEMENITAAKQEVIAACDKIVDDFHEVPAAIASQESNITLMQDQITNTQNQLTQAINNQNQNEIARLSQEKFDMENVLQQQQANLANLKSTLSSDLEIIKANDLQLYNKFITLDPLKELDDLRKLKDNLDIMMEETEDLAFNEFLAKTIILEENDLNILSTNKIMQTDKSEIVRGQKPCDY